MPWIISIIGALLIVWLIVPGGFFFPEIKQKASSKSQQVEVNSEVESLKKQLQEKNMELIKLRSGLDYKVTQLDSVGLCAWPLPQKGEPKYHLITSNTVYNSEPGLHLCLYSLKDLETGIILIGITRGEKLWPVDAVLESSLNQSDGITIAVNTGSAASNLRKRFKVK